MARLYRRHRGRPDPTPEDLAKWKNAQTDLLDHLYTGPTGFLQRWGHRVLRRFCGKARGLRVLEVGCGHGHHLRFYPEIARDNFFVGLDISGKFLAEAASRHGEMRVVQGDAYALPFTDDSYDRVLSIYNLEHLRDLEQALVEVRRVLKPDGRFLVAVPAEGGFLYNVGREFTSRPYMEKKYGLDYDAIIKHEHCNEFWTIRDALARVFAVRRRRYLPFLLPSAHLNAIVCFECRPR